jgi:chromosome segregation protein
MADASSRVETHTAEIEECRAEVMSAVSELEEKKETLRVLRKKQDELRLQADELASDARNHRTKVSVLREEASRIDIRIHELRTERQHIVERVQEEHQRDVLELTSDCFEVLEFDHKAAEERISFLREKIAQMGEVNPGAVEEFEELNERYEFLSSQKADLEASIESLLKAIRKINRTSRERFMETFTRVSENFSSLFPRLFDGGSADMILLDGSDPLNTGVEIQVRLPGKRLKSMQLLSGGEKALVSLTMILSMFLAKPSPVCILDEVDAPLDDENLGNFSEIIREMSEKYQFLIISHNKLTMESADVLYGITMREPGASQVVSVRLKDVA